MTVEHSRALLLGESATGVSRSRLEERLDTSVVAVSADPAVPMSALTTRVLMSTLRRGLGTLVLVRDGLSATFVDTLVETVAAIDPERPLRVERPLRLEPTVHVHVGTDPHARAIRIVPEGYGAHIANARTAVIRPRRGGNELGAVYTAALGAAEVFKHTARVLIGRRVLHRHLRFCPVSLTDDLGGAAELPEGLTIDLSLIGVGAIGTGIVLALSEMPVQGRLLAVDRQRFAAENRGTYSLGGAADVEAKPWKVEIAQRTLERFEVEPFRGSVEELLGAVDAGRATWFPTVLTALDSPEARREAQRLWPDRFIDAATGDTMLGLCDHRADVDPCMMCVFQVDRDQPSGVERLAQQVGLPVEVLALGDAPLTEEHLLGLTAEQRLVFVPHLGKPICGLANAAGLTNLDADGYMPSIPFVSLQAACLSVGRLVAAQLGRSPAANFVQYDGLFGPQTATVDTMKRRADCSCVTRRDAIRQVRRERLRRMQTGQ